MGLNAQMILDAFKSLPDEWQSYYIEDISHEGPLTNVIIDGAFDLNVVAERLGAALKALREQEQREALQPSYQVVA